MYVSVALFILAVLRVQKFLAAAGCYSLQTANIGRKSALCQVFVPNSAAERAFLRRSWLVWGQWCSAQQATVTLALTPLLPCLVFLAVVFDCTLGFEGEGPKISRHLKYRSTYTDADLLDAVKDVIYKRFAPSAALTRNPGIPRSTFYRKVKCARTGKPLLVPAGRAPVLTVAEETRLMDWIHDNAACGFPLNSVCAASGVAYADCFLVVRCTAFCRDHPGKQSRRRPRYGTLHLNTVTLMTACCIAIALPL